MVPLTRMPSSPLKPMDQSRRGVIQVLEAQMHPLVMAIPRFIQLSVPLPPLKSMGQSRRGVIRLIFTLLICMRHGKGL
jgi:hypothetical protein